MLGGRDERSIDSALSALGAGGRVCRLEFNKDKNFSGSRAFSAA